VTITSFLQLVLSCTSEEVWTTVSSSSDQSESSSNGLK
jgi:hypothetical protein